MWLSSLKIKIQIFFFFFLKTFSELTMLKLKIIVCVNIVRFVQFCCSFWVPGTSLTLTPWVQKAQKISFSSNLPEEKNKQSNKQKKNPWLFFHEKKKTKTKITRYSNEGPSNSLLIVHQEEKLRQSFSMPIHKLVLKLQVSCSLNYFMGHKFFLTVASESPMMPNHYGFLWSQEFYQSESNTFLIARK